jgi:hypothetical protein
LGNPFGPFKLRSDAPHAASVKVEIVLVAAHAGASASASTAVSEVRSARDSMVRRGQEVGAVGRWVGWRDGGIDGVTRLGDPAGWAGLARGGERAQGGEDHGFESRAADLYRPCLREAW